MQQLLCFIQVVHSQMLASKYSAKCFAAGVLYFMAQVL